MNMRTGEARIVVAFDRARNEVTFARDPKWYAATDWRTTLATPTPEPTR